MTTSQTYQTDSTYTGIAILNDASDTFDGEPPWIVNGIAMTPSVTHGAAGVPRFWPEPVLKEAAEKNLLDGAPIVKNFHDLNGQAPADDVIGKVTDTGYVDGVGLAYEGEIADKEIAKKVANGYLDVSVVPHIGSETLDEERDVHVVEEIVDFRDIAVVAEGAMANNSIEMGPNPAIAALSADALAKVFNVGSDTTALLENDETETETETQEQEEVYDTDLISEMDAEAEDLLEDGGRYMTGADWHEFFDENDVPDNEWGTTIASISSMHERLHELMHAAAEHHKEMLGDESDESDENEESLDEDEDVEESTEDSDDEDDEDEDSLSDETDADDDITEPLEESTESEPVEEKEEENDALAQADSALERAMIADVLKTGSTPDRCRTIKDGAKPVNTESNPLAQEVLRSQHGTRPSESNPTKINVYESDLARDVLNIDEKEPTEVDLSEDSVARTALGLESDDETDDESESDESEKSVLKQAGPVSAAEIADLRDDPAAEALLENATTSDPDAQTIPLDSDLAKETLKSDDETDKQPVSTESKPVKTFSGVDFDGLRDDPAASELLEQAESDPDAETISLNDPIARNLLDLDDDEDEEQDAARAEYARRLQQQLEFDPEEEDIRDDPAVQQLLEGQVEFDDEEDENPARWSFAEEIDADLTGDDDCECDACERERRSVDLESDSLARQALGLDSLSDGAESHEDDAEDGSGDE